MLPAKFPPLFIMSAEKAGAKAPSGSSTRGSSRRNAKRDFAYVVDWKKSKSCATRVNNVERVWSSAPVRFYDPEALNKFLAEVN